MLESALANYVAQIQLVHLREAIGYALMTGGKRLRPSLTLATAQACAQEHTTEEARTLALPAAVAVELVHNYSLIHDDLPAMDNDLMRRGKPTVHVAFGEATAILAGDALLADAFMMLSQSTYHVADQVHELAHAAGGNGMVAGQDLDITAHLEKNISSTQWETIHALKTGRLFAAACVLGALSVNAPAAVVESMRQFGETYGAAYQLYDDMQDNDALAEKVGSTSINNALQRTLAKAQAHLEELTGDTTALKLLLRFNLAD